jgi:hypothetical protein
MPEKFRRPHHHERVQAVEWMRRAREAERAELASRPIAGIAALNRALRCCP